MTPSVSLIGFSFSSPTHSSLFCPTSAGRFDNTICFELKGPLIVIPRLTIAGGGGDKSRRPSSCYPTFDSPKWRSWMIALRIRAPGEMEPFCSTSSSVRFRRQGILMRTNRNNNRFWMTLASSVRSIPFYYFYG
ncbi:hypothetical protein BJY00DRAFT_229321 [Aspergillus carlsbadensis]|nr:hypothetical protein BJY00DRAFT_229321 [Aspergillus carlsbadensis]